MLIEIEIALHHRGVRTTSFASFKPKRLNHSHVFHLYNCVLKKNIYEFLSVFKAYVALLTLSGRTGYWIANLVTDIQNFYNDSFGRKRIKFFTKIIEPMSLLLRRLLSDTQSCEILIFILRYTLSFSFQKKCISVLKACFTLPTFSRKGERLGGPFVFFSKSTYLAFGRG